MTAPRSLAVPAGGFRRIAVLRLSSLGDVVLTLPVVHALRREWPEAELQYWVKEEYAAVLRHDPAVSRVRALERDARRLEDLVSMSAELEDRDLVVDLHGSVRTRVLAFRLPAPVLRLRGRRLERERWVRARWTRPAPLPHATARYAEVLAPLGLAAAEPPRLTLDPEAAAWAEVQHGGFGRREVVALCPGARHATKCWPEERWCELEAALAEAGVARVVLTTPAERRAMPRLAAQVSGGEGAVWATESLERSIAWLSRCTLAVTHDSGLMHVAAACGKPVVALFGSTSPVLGFAPCGPGHAVLSRELPCQPCTVHGR
ncbi:MAG: glycosyltransferase family 9 protein, partial [Candidatus Eisenbacteria bacterium]